MHPTCASLALITITAAAHITKVVIDVVSQESSINFVHHIIQIVAVADAKLDKIRYNMVQYGKYDKQQL